MKLELILKEYSELFGYKITEFTRESCELFFVHNKLETTRKTDTTDITVTVYVEHDGCLGDSKFGLHPQSTEKEIRDKTEKAINRAKLIFNQKYLLPKEEKCDYSSEEKNDESEMWAKASKIADVVFEAGKIDKGSVNALEIFVYRDTEHVINSNGLDKKQTKTHMMLEAIPTFTDGESVELYESQTFTVPDYEVIKERISSKMAQVRDRKNAKRIDIPKDIKVIINAKEINSLADELTYYNSYESIYSHMNLFNKGDKIVDGYSGDSLSITMNGRIEGSSESAFFDSDGVSLKDVEVIKENVVNASYGSSRFGQYLGVEEPSGRLECISLKPGSRTIEEILSGKYLECVSFSGIQVDLFNDYLGGEIRLAYLCDGDERIPVSGITMSARLSEVLKNMYLSDDTVIDENYSGPSLMLFSGVEFV